nr:phage terminase large subunit [Sinorhizobium meliloti]
MAADPSYLASLMALPTVERERLLGGNWKIRRAARLLFRRGWCEIVDAIPAGARWMRGWDLGATPKTESNDPDWTAGIKIGKLPDSRYIVAHHCRDRLSPSGVERLIKNTAESDGKDVQISLRQDPGQAGKSQVTNLTKMLAGFTVRATPESGDSADGAQVEIHPSRLVIFNGSQQPDEDIVTTAYAGWGDSVLLSVVDAIKQADGTAANIASLVFEAKVNVIRIPDFMQNLGNAEYRAKILERYTLAATAKGINGDLLLDKEEEYEQKTASFATLPEVLMSFLQIVSGAADIPATRLLGQSPAGMNATGESDLRNYYDRLQAMQTVEMTPAMARLDECIIRSALGSRDPDIYCDWAPLWGMSEKEKADVFKTKADAARQLVGSGTGQEIITREAVSDALVNTFIEDGSLPGLDAAIEEYGKLSEQEPDESEERAASMPPSV